MYWRSGFVMEGCCAPVFLTSHASTLLTIGKAINLLKLCNPKVCVFAHSSSSSSLTHASLSNIQHPLCSGQVQPVQLRLHFTAEGLEGVHVECQRYSELIRKHIDTREKRRLDQVCAGLVPHQASGNGIIHWYCSWRQ